MDHLILDLCQFESRCYSFISRRAPLNGRSRPKNKEEWHNLLFWNNECKVFSSVNKMLQNLDFEQYDFGQSNFSTMEKVEGNWENWFILKIDTQSLPSCLTAHDIDSLGGTILCSLATNIPHNENQKHFWTRFLMKLKRKDVKKLHGEFAKNKDKVYFKILPTLFNHQLFFQ